MFKLTPTHIILIVLVIILVITFLYKYPKHKTNSNSKKAILYYIDGCQFCTDFKPIWEKLEADGVKGITFISVDSDKYPEIAAQNNVNQYPTVHIQNKEGTSLTEYKGEMSYNGLKSYLLA